MKDWFLGLDARDRKIVAGLALLIVIFSLYGFIVKPLGSSYQALKQGVAQQKETLAWMREAAGKVKSLKGSAPAGSAGLAGRSLLAVVDQSARSAGLGNFIKRIEPDGSKGVKVWLEGVAFDPMVLWLGKLTRDYRVQTRMITIEHEGPGRVNVRLNLLESGA